MRHPLCIVAGAIPSWGKPGGVLEAHRSRCLRCQAIAARRRLLTREFAVLAAEVLPAPPGLLEAVTGRLEVQDSADPRRALVMRALWRHAAAGATAAAAVALVLGSLVRWRSHLPA